MARRNLDGCFFRLRIDATVHGCCRAPARRASARAFTRSAEAGSRPPAAPTFPPRRPNAATIERGGDLPKRLRAGGLGLANGRRNAVGECVGAGRVDRTCR